MKDVPPEVTQVLQTLQKVCDERGIPLILIGAQARIQIVDRQLHGVERPRTTKDVDFAVRVEDWNEFNALKSSLTGAGFSSTKLPHRLKHTLGIEIDLVPFGGVETDGLVEWPGSGEVMDVTGLEEAYERQDFVPVPGSTALDVVSVPRFVVLKFFAYRDRRDHSKKDMPDIVYVMKNYLRLASNETRIFDELDDTIGPDAIEREHSGGYLLGLDIGRLCGPATLRRLLPILEECLDPYSRAVSDAIGLISDSDYEERERQRMSQAFQALRAGIDRAL